MSKILLLIRDENSDYANEKYVAAIENFGGKVIYIYDYDSEDIILNKLMDVDGILLPGGDKVGKWDYFLIEYALNNNLKLLGICQGMQSMALYGSDEKLVEIGNLDHKKEEGYVHSVELSFGKLRNIYGKDKILVNSHHIQTVTNSHKFLIVGKSVDGLIEALESDNSIFQIGVQWHPERMIDYDEDSFKLLKAFLDE